MKVLAIMILCVQSDEDYVIVMNETKFIKITFELIIIRNVFLVIISSPIL